MVNVLQAAFWRVIAETVKRIAKGAEDDQTEGRPFDRTEPDHPRSPIVTNMSPWHETITTAELIVDPHV